MFIDAVMQYLQVHAGKGNEAAQHYLNSLKDAERFRIDNIADYIHETFVSNEDGPMDFDVPNEIPNIASLAGMLWFEMHGDLWERAGQNRSGCLLAVAHDVKEDGPDTSVPEQARWIVIATIFVSEENHFFVGNACHGLVIGFDGKPLDVRALKSPFLSEREYSDIQNSDWLNNLNPCLEGRTYSLKRSRALRAVTRCMAFALMMRGKSTYSGCE